MSSQNKRRRMSREAHGCAGKIRYGDSVEALRNAKRLAVIYRKQLEPYPCNQCHGYHVGSPKDSRRQA